MESYQVAGQLSIFDYPEFLPEKPNKKRHILKVGDKIGKIILGECEITTVTEVNNNYDDLFYRTAAGICYSAEDGENDIEELIKLAAEKHKNYKTIIPGQLENRITVRYAPRKCDGKILWAQIGIFNNMLFWKEDYTYQFLEPYSSKRKLDKAYNMHKSKILKGDYELVSDQLPIKELYWSSKGFFADARYVACNP